MRPKLTAAQPTRSSSPRRHRCAPSSHTRAARAGSPAAREWCPTRGAVPTYAPPTSPAGAVAAYSTVCAAASGLRAAGVRAGAAGRKRRPGTSGGQGAAGTQSGSLGSRHFSSPAGRGSCSWVAGRSPPQQARAEEVLKEGVGQRAQQTGRRALQPRDGSVPTLVGGVQDASQLYLCRLCIGFAATHRDQTHWCWTPHSRATAGRRDRAQPALK